MDRGLLGRGVARRAGVAISRLVRADAWWPIPLDQGRFTRGDVIEVREFRDIS